MDLQVDTSEFVERNTPHKSWVRQPLHRNQNLYNRLIRALVADNAEDKFRFIENHPEISRNIKNRVYKKPNPRSDNVIEDFLGQYTEQILDDCAAFRRNNKLWLKCPKLPSSKDIWKKTIIPNQLLPRNYSKKRNRYSSKYITSESEFDSDSPPELTAETYDCFVKQSKKTKISSSNDDSDYMRLNLNTKEICMSDLNYSRDNSYDKITESTVTEKLTNSKTEDNNVNINNFVRSVDSNNNNNNNNNNNLNKIQQIPRKPKSTWLNRLVESNYSNIITNNNQSTSKEFNDNENIYKNEKNNNMIVNNIINSNNNNNDDDKNKSQIDDKKIYDYEDNKIENEVNISIDSNNNNTTISSSNDNDNNNNNDDDIININNDDSDSNNNNDSDSNNNNNSDSNKDDDDDDDDDDNDTENNCLRINDIELLSGNDFLTGNAMHVLLNYYYWQQKDDQFRDCFKIMPLNSNFDDLKKYQKSNRAKYNTDEYVFICIEERQDFYGIILKRLRFKMFFDERVVVLNSNHKYENKHLIKIIQNLRKHINEVDYYSELDYPHQLNRPVSNIYLVYFFKWLTIENLEKLFEDEPCEMPLALSKNNLEMLKADYIKILYNFLPNKLRKLSNLNFDDFNA